MTNTTASPLRTEPQVESAFQSADEAPFFRPRNPRSAEALLSTQELADYFDVPLKTIYAWRHQGRGPRGFRVGRHLRFRWSDVQGWVSEQLDGTG
jgi:excisionase family DNA binding protein